MNLSNMNLTKELKVISPFIQRAEELKDKEPIMAYWCGYYAAQIGISLKAKDTASRNILLELLGELELLKKKIGPNDAIDVESASVAYVENFALRVFSAADNEDRSGKGNRSTAKKFLAAANFLEVIKIFPTTEVSESNEEKIRYAKWKAADIAKAYREGRKPTPGPANSGIDLPSVPDTTGEPQQDIPPFPSRNTSSSIDTIVQQPETPPPHISSEHIVQANNHPPNLTVPDISDGFLAPPNLASGENTPGNWSTVATPGTAGLSPNTEQELGWETDDRHKAWVSDEIENDDDSIGVSQRKEVHFVPTPPATVASERSLPPVSPPAIYAAPPAIAVPPPPVVVPFDLTPALISKAQKHCRFAASALDYEDIEQAKKELRNALALLGG